MTLWTWVLLVQAPFQACNSEWLSTRIVPAGWQCTCVISCIVKSHDNLLVSTSYTHAQKLIAKHLNVRHIIVRVWWALVGSYRLTCSLRLCLLLCLSVMSMVEIYGFTYVCIPIWHVQDSRWQQARERVRRYRKGLTYQQRNEGQQDNSDRSDLLHSLTCKFLTSLWPHFAMCLVWGTSWYL